MVNNPTIQELEKILDNGENLIVEILPNGEIRAKTLVEIRNDVINDVVNKSAEIRQELLEQSKVRFKPANSKLTDNHAEKQWGYRKGIREFARAFGESLKADTNNPKKRGGCYPDESQMNNLQKAVKALLDIAEEQIIHKPNPEYGLKIRGIAQKALAQMFGKRWRDKAMQLLDRKDL